MYSYARFYHHSFVYRSHSGTRQERRKMNKEIKTALEIINKATEGATEGASLIEAITILISQRDNARKCKEFYHDKLKELGYTMIG